MDERVRATLSTCESVADRYATIHDDRDVVADIVARFLDALAGDGSDTRAETRVLTDDGVLGIAMKRANPDKPTESPYEPDELRALLADAGFAVRDAITSERWVFLVARV